MEQFFSDPRILIRLRQGPLGQYLDSYAQELSEQGYSHSSGYAQIKLISDFGRWLKLNHLVVEAITSEHTSKYLRYRTRKQCLGRGDAAALKRFLGTLRRKNVIAEEGGTVQSSLAERLTDEFVDYLRKERGLAIPTITGYRWHIIRFLNKLFSGPTTDLSTLCAMDVIDFVRTQAALLDVKTAKLMTSALRSFLHYTRYQGYVDTDLAAAVPTVAMWSKASIPKSLPADKVDQLLSSCNRHTANGKRDYAILLLLARLGLRAGEIVSLVLDDIDWQSGHISIRGKSKYRPRLPIPTHVGEALADYLQHGRPRTTSCRAVFLRTRAPIGRFNHVSAVSCIVRRAILRAGLDTPRKGAHQLRHGLATEMLRQGASLAEIGELLGHCHPDTTTIYAKVDLISLRSLALAWPGGPNE